MLTLLIKNSVIRQVKPRWWHQNSRLFMMGAKNGVVCKAVKIRKSGGCSLMMGAKGKELNRIRLKLIESGYEPMGLINRAANSEMSYGLSSFALDNPGGYFVGVSRFGVICRRWDRKNGGMQHPKVWFE